MPTPDSPLILLSFDVEEFDVPIEHGRPIHLQEQLRVGRVGLERVLNVLSAAHTSPPATLFTTAVFAQAFPSLINTAAARHEIASHGYSHGPLMAGDLEKSRSVLASITSQPIRGFRRARMANTDTADIARAGFEYNSSLHPTYMPRKYNNLRKPRRPYFDGDLLNIPVSVTPRLRIPMFWAAFKNFPLWFVKRCVENTLAHDGVVNFYWHPWEFADLDIYGLPRSVRAIQGQALCDRLAHFLDWLSTRATFSTFGAYADTFINNRKDQRSPPAPPPPPPPPPPITTQVNVTAQAAAPPRAESHA